VTRTSHKPVVLVSACLMGCCSRYDADVRKICHERLAQWQRKGLVLSFCPETAGGLPVPRPPAEISGGEGGDVLAGDTQVLTREGRDLTENFISGARLTLAAVRHYAIRTAMLKDGSPSCGITRIYDGSFKGQPVPGQGVTAALLAVHRVALYSEQGLAEAWRRLRREFRNSDGWAP